MRSINVAATRSLNFLNIRLLSNRVAFLSTFAAFLLFAPLSYAQPALIAEVKAASSNNNDVTSAAIDTTGANFIAAFVANYPVAAENAFSDSKSNSWTALTACSLAGNTRGKWYYATNPTVGTNHTFTAGTVVTSYPAIYVYAFSNMATSSPLDAEGACVTSASTQTLQATSTSSSAANGVFVTGITWVTALTGPSVDSSFEPADTILTTTNNMPSGASYKIKATAGAEAPTWSWTNAQPTSLTIAVFKAAASSACGRLTLLGVGC